MRKGRAGARAGPVDRSLSDPVAARGRDREPPWIEVVAPGPARVITTPVDWRTVLIEMAVAALVVFVLVGAAGAIAAWRVAENEAVTDALRSCDLIARSALEPALTDAVVPVPVPTLGTVAGLPRTTTPPGPVAPDPAHVAELRRLDHVVHALVLSSTVVRVKLWTPDGQVVYSDEGRLIGQQFGLDDTGRRALHNETTIGELSDLKAPENEFERSDGRLLEVYRPVHTPSGQPLVFETYSHYDPILIHSGQMWRDILVITVGSLLLMHVLWVPLSWVLMNRLRQARRQRDVLVDRALSASAAERRRIAGTLHDGVVQELVATSFIVAGSAQQVAQPELAAQLETAAASVRASLGALRSLLVDIYPPNLGMAGLSATLADLATALRTRGMQVSVTEDPELHLDPDTQTLVYRVAQECLRNADRHARASQASVRISRRDNRIRLEVADNGIGFEPAPILAAAGGRPLRTQRDPGSDRRTGGSPAGAQPTGRRHPLASGGGRR